MAIETMIEEGQSEIPDNRGKFVNMTVPLAYGPVEAVIEMKGKVYFAWSLEAIKAREGSVCFGDPPESSGESARSEGTPVAP